MHLVICFAFFILIWMLCKLKNREYSVEMYWKPRVGLSKTQTNICMSGWEPCCKLSPILLQNDQRGLSSAVEVAMETSS